MRIPDCAYCGETLRGTRHVRVTIEDGIGAPTIGWHGGCLAADNGLYNLSLDCKQPENISDRPSVGWIPKPIQVVLRRGHSRVSAGPRFWKAINTIAKCW